METKEVSYTAISGELVCSAASADEDTSIVADVATGAVEEGVRNEEIFMRKRAY